MTADRCYTANVEIAETTSAAPSPTLTGQSADTLVSLEWVKRDTQS